MAAAKGFSFLFVLFVALKKRIPSKICILSCLIEKRSANLLRVFDIHYTVLKRFPVL